MRIQMALGPESPLQIRINGTGSNFSSGFWLPLAPKPACNVDQHWCEPTTNTVMASVPPSVASLITGIRYAWGENPCCPSVNRFSIGCPPNSCPIQTYNTTLPAVPFWATVDPATGQCSWVSTSGAPLPASA